MLGMWGRMSSLNVRKVVWALQELGVEFERVEAGGQFGVVETPQYKALNPNRLVPVIDDEGFRLWESNVIVRYLCAKHSEGDLYPAPLLERFDAERWMDWQQTTLNPAGAAAFMQTIRTPPEQRQPHLIVASVAKTEPLLAILDEHLATRAFIAGDRFTMADIPIGCQIQRWRALPVERLLRPNIARWYESIRTRPGAAGVLDLPVT